MCICVQHVGTHKFSVKNYQLACRSPTKIDELGTAIFVHNKVTFEPIQLQAGPLQASALKLHLPDNRNITLCNIYNQPSHHYDLALLPQILNQCSQPLLLMGDFNAHHPLWDDNCIQADTPGLLLENLLNADGYCCLNESESKTYLSLTHGTLSSVDITICSADIVDRFEWIVSDDLYTSDHYPIIISYLGHSPLPYIPRFNINKADWDKFRQYTRDIPMLKPSEGHSETFKFFTD